MFILPAVSRRSTLSVRVPRMHSREYRSSTVGRYRSLKPWPSSRRIMALLPTPAPPSTTSLILSRSAIFSSRSHSGDLEHDCKNVVASGWHHPGGRSKSRPPPGNPIRSPYPPPLPPAPVKVLLLRLKDINLILRSDSWPQSETSRW